MDKTYGSALFDDLLILRALIATNSISQKAVAIMRLKRVVRKALEKLVRRLPGLPFLPPPAFLPYL